MGATDWFCERAAFALSKTRWPHVFIRMLSKIDAVYFNGHGELRSCMYCGTDRIFKVQK